MFLLGKGLNTAFAGVVLWLGWLAGWWWCGRVGVLGAQWCGEGGTGENQCIQIGIHMVVLMPEVKCLV